MKWFRALSDLGTSVSVRESISIVFASMFGVAALAKLAEFDALTELLAKVGLSRSLAPAAGLSLIVLELFACIGLILGLRRICIPVIIALAAGFASLSIWRFRTHYAGPCHCFGHLLSLSATQSLIVSAALLVFALTPGYWKPLTSWTLARLTVTAIVIGIVVLIGISAPEQNRSAVLNAPVHGVVLDPPYGVVSLDRGATQVSFTLRNVSEEPVTIHSIPSCSCVKGSWPRAVIKPHKSLVYLTTGAMPEYVLFRPSSTSIEYILGRPNSESRGTQQ